MQLAVIVPARNISSSKLHNPRSYLPMPESASLSRDFRVYGEAVLFGRLVRYVEFERDHCLPQLSPFPADHQLALGKLREKICNIVPASRERTMLVINVITGTLSLVAVSMRFISRYLVCKRLWFDDGIILSAMVSYSCRPYEDISLGPW